MTDTQVGLTVSRKPTLLCEQPETEFWDKAVFPGPSLERRLLADPVIRRSDSLR